MDNNQSENNVIGQKDTCFAVINRDEKVVRNSSSGGVFYALAQSVIQKGGVVFGAAFDENLKLKHTFAQNMQQVEKLMRSKYVQSDLTGCFERVKDFLQNERYVLFCGTPCECNGLKAYLKRDYEKLLIVDFICHGTPSPKIFEKYVKELEKKYKSEIVDYNFRDKVDGWEYSTTIQLKDGKKYSTPAWQDSYMRLFLSNISLMKGCYSCIHKGENRSSDITMGDFWGVKENYPEFYDKNGVSLVIVNTKKGFDTLDGIKGVVKCNAVDKEKALQNNSCYYESAKENKNREEFFKNLDKITIEKADKKYLKTPLTKRLRSFLGKVKRKLFKK